MIIANELKQCAFSFSNLTPIFVSEAGAKTEQRLLGRDFWITKVRGKMIFILAALMKTDVCMVKTND